MSLPITSALAGLAWYLSGHASAFDNTSPAIEKIIQALPVSHLTLTSLAKWAFAISSAHYLSSGLTGFARNNWRLADTHRWKWKEEIAVVTGGCSGIGEEIVKALAKKGVKVVIIDVSDLPERLEGGETMPDILVETGLTGSRCPVHQMRRRRLRCG
jgi:3-oxoacyl-ACP reductase-like protein